MIQYQIADYRPVGIPVRRPLGQAVVVPAPVVSTPVVPGPVVPTGVRAAVGFSSLLATALGAGTAWIGIRSGQRERKTTFKVMGYTVAVFGALVALSGVGGILGTTFSPLLSGKSAQA